MSMVNFDATSEDMAAIDAIIERAKKANNRNINIMALMMDITACHCNGTPLNLPALLVADDFNFWHDLAGIIRHIDRTTGAIGGCFIPRFAVTSARFDPSPLTCQQDIIDDLANEAVTDEDRIRTFELNEEA